MAAALGVPVSAIAFGFLALVLELQSLTHGAAEGAGLRGDSVVVARPPLGLAGLLVGVTVRHLPGGRATSPSAGRCPPPPGR
ncbi:Chloride channel protein OS=Streptomyces microflavus OX=1919 GN=G3I39_24625 PE=4 SV=1 [Streptomyces microflavus]